jgi:hypothetical protein
MLASKMGFVVGLQFIHLIATLLRLLFPLSCHGFLFFVRAKGRETEISEKDVLGRLLTGKRRNPT